MQPTPDNVDDLPDPANAAPQPPLDNPEALPAPAPQKSPRTSGIRTRLAFEADQTLTGGVRVSGITRIPIDSQLPISTSDQTMTGGVRVSGITRIPFESQPPLSTSGQTMTGGAFAQPTQPTQPTQPQPRARTRVRFDDAPPLPPVSSDATLSFSNRPPSPQPSQHAQPTLTRPSADNTMTGGLGMKITGGSAKRRGFEVDPALSLVQSAMTAYVATHENISVWKVGEVIDGKYEVIEIAGQGGMGVVYRIRHREWNLEMAVKTPLPALVKDPAAKGRFFREAQIWVDLGLHPNIVQCWFVRELGGLPRVFVDYLAGGSLKDWFVQGRVKAGQYDKIIDLMAQACDGLGYAHERGVVHRDIKPGNMLMSEDGRLCITDFGLVKLAGVEDIPSCNNGPKDALAMTQQAAADLTQTGFSLGTPQYGAPEQWGQAKNVDARADIYALGITLFELCCGRRPFDQPGKGEPAQVIIARHLGSAPPDPRSLRADVPDSLANLILRCLQKSPDKRPSSLVEIRRELEAAHQIIYGRPLDRAVPEAAESRASGLNNRAASMWDLGQPEQAMSAWSEALALDPRHAESLYNSSLMEYRTGRITDLDAKQRLHEAARSQKKAQLFLGFLQLETCDAIAAQKSFDEALKDPAIKSDGIAWRSLGHALIAQEKFREAEDAYQKARELMSGDDDAKTGSELARKHIRTVAGQLSYPHIGEQRVIEERVGSIHAIAAAPDGRSIFTDGVLNAICQFELPTGKPLGTFSGPAKQVLGIAATPDGKMLVCGGEDAQLRAWNLATKLPADDFYGKGHIGSIYSVAISPDSRFAVTSGSDKSVRLWDLSKGTVTKTLWGHTEAVHAAQFSPDGRHIASGSADGTIRIWSFPDGVPGPVLTGARTPIQTLAYSEDGAFLYSGGTDGRLLKWNCKTHLISTHFKGHRGTVNALDLAKGHNGRFLFSCGDDTTVRLWDTKSGQCLRTIQGHKGAVLTLAVPNDMAVLVSGAAENLGQPLRLWTLELERFARTPGTSDPYSAAMAICRIEKLDQSQLAARQFNALLMEATTAWQFEYFAAAYTHLNNARKIPGYERDPRALELNAQLSRKLPLKGIAAVYLRREIEGRHPNGFKAALFSNDGKSAISAGRNDKTILSWDLDAGTCSRKLEGHKQPVEGIALVPGLPLLVSAGADYTVGIWDMLSGTLKTVLSGHTGEVNAVAVSKDGRLIASASSDATVRIWDIAAQKCVRTFAREGSDEPFVTVKFLPDTRHFIAGARDGYLEHRSLITGRLVREYSGHFGLIQDLAVFREKPWFISAGEDKSLRCWNLETGENIWTTRDGQSRFHAIAFSPDQRFVITGGMEMHDTQVRIWDAATGEPRGVVCPHTKGISALALNDDGSTLITATEDKYLRVWELEWELIGIDPKSALSPTGTQIRSGGASSPSIKRVSLVNINAARPNPTAQPAQTQPPPAAPTAAQPSPKHKLSIFLNTKEKREDKT